MYWWRTEPLKARLAAGSLPESEKLNYLIATFTTNAIFMELGYLLVDPEDQITGIDWLASALIILATPIGIYYCYRRNLEGDGQSFLERFICLGWPVLIRTLAAFLVFIVAYFFSGFAIGGDEFERLMDTELFMTATLTAWAIGFEVAFYWYLGLQIHDTATRAFALPPEENGRDNLVANP
jgi:hypothetical protein